MPTKIKGLMVAVLLLLLLPQSSYAGDCTYGPDTCTQGFVWREASQNDHVCVTPQEREKTSLDNTLADQRRDPNGGVYGPDTCLQGFVWRDAFSGDHVCVTPETRAQAAQDNQNADTRKACSGDCTYGPDTCIQGFVWRDAFSGDYVCVTPETRAQAAQDNQNADSRKACSQTSIPPVVASDCTYGPDTCTQGFVWREAVPGDHVCVTPETRAQAAQDNQNADSRKACS